jgi:hypothetical protein
MNRLKALQWPDLITAAVGVILAGAAWQNSGPIVGVVCFVLVGLVVLYLGAMREVDRLHQEREDEKAARIREAITSGRWPA